MSTSRPAPGRGRRGINKSAVRLAALVVAVVAVVGGFLIGHFTGTKHKTVSARVMPNVNGPAGQSWPTADGSLSNERFSTLSQINASNVKSLVLSRSIDVDTPSTSTGSGGQFNPIVINGVLFAESGSGTLGAYNLATGKTIWQKTAEQLGNKIPYGTRGIAYGDGRLYVDQMPGVMYAINAANGKTIWEANTNTEHVNGYSAATAIYADGLVIVGQSGSDIIGGARGYVMALHAATGKVAWTSYALPSLSDPNAETWGNPKKELKDGGGNTWTNVAVDSKLGIVYIPTGNTWPDMGRTQGDEYYTDGLSAVSLKTGKRLWFFQTTHHDEWDYDCSNPPVLWDKTINGKAVQGVSIACKNGYAYQLNRVTGKPVTPVKEEPLSNAKSDPAAKKYDEQKLDWLGTGGKQLTEPIPTGKGSLTPHCASPSLMPSKAPDGSKYWFACTYNYYSPDHFTAGTVEQPLNWQPSAYSQDTGYSYYCTNNGVRAVKINDVNAKQTNNNEVWPQLDENGSAGAEPKQGYFSAVDVSTNNVVWQNKYAEQTSCTGGAAVTAGNVVFGSDSSGDFLADNAKTGKPLWKFNLPGMSIVAPPIVYAAGGVEYVGVMATNQGKAVFLAWGLKGKVPATVDVTKQRTQVSTSGPAIFTANCASCHTLAAAGAYGTVGPDLDALKPTASEVNSQVQTGSRTMPAFGGTLSKKQIAAVSQYVASLAGKKTGAGQP